MRVCRFQTSTKICFQKEFQLATKTLAALLKLVSLIGLTVVAFGLPYSFLALKIYGGDILSTGSGKKSETLDATSSISLLFV